MMIIKKLTATLALALIMSWGAALKAQTGYYLVVNDANPSSSMAKADVAKLFLKKTTKWDSGLMVQPVDQAVSRSVRKAFTKAVHGKSVSSIKSYWQRQVFSGRGTPPTELDSDSQVLAYVRNNSGAIGYVSAGTSLGSGVKILRVSDG